MPEQRGNDRTSYYTMKTPGRSQLTSSSSQSHSRSNSQNFFNMNKSNSPMESPRMPYSVGQQYPPRLSPGVSRSSLTDVRTPSPNYFGLDVEPNPDPRDSGALPRDNWSPPTSSVKSFGAAIPKQMPLDANPEFEAFKRQADLNRGRTGFNLSTTHFGLVDSMTLPSASTPSAQQRPRPPRWHTHDSNATESPLKTGGPVRPVSKPADTGGRPEDVNSLHDSAYVSGDSKRNSEVSLHQPALYTSGSSRFESPAQFQTPFVMPDQRKPNHYKIDERHPRLSVSGEARSPGLSGATKPRADTVPPTLESGGPTLLSPSQLKTMLESDNPDEVLLLDLRVSPQYAASRIIGALNFCVPTTLLKRPTFNLQKLQQTFRSEQDQETFARWNKANNLVVYDASSTEKRDATSGMNMLKKFTTEGYTGAVHVLRGGFNAFAAAYPQFIDRSTGSAAPGLSLGGAGPAQGAAGANFVPVIGGVSLPGAAGTANPFFSNIRQNQDLVDGVGQMDVALPPTLNPEGLPRWLRDTTESEDRGKKVSDKFLHIELTEQKRMKDAYSSFNTNLKEKSAAGPRVQLSGIEKGGKNRYKDILPFEHARVKLQGPKAENCDYVNASHIKATRSNKRYIASQGPLPATFEDFWSMIWEQDVRVVVMLTAESEGGQLKCHPYWKGRDFGPIRLRALSEKKISLDIDKYRSNPAATPHLPNLSSAGGSSSASGSSAPQDAFSWNTSAAETGRRRANTTTSLEGNVANPSQPQHSGEIPHVIIRKFALSHASFPFAPMREVTHLHYASWPDFGAPAQPSHLLALVELANVMQHAALPSKGPESVRGDDHAHPADATSHGESESSSPVLKRQDSSTRNRGDSLGWHDAPEYDENARPMLVHCSAGCGRTGTFCTVDSVIDMLKRQRLQAVKAANEKIASRERQTAQDTKLDLEPPLSPATDAEGDVLMDFDHGSATPTNEYENIDLTWLGDDSVDLIAQTVEDFRRQRLSMVQSLRQFVLCYETVTEWVWRLQERSAGQGRGRHNRTSSLAV